MVSVRASWSPSQYCGIPASAYSWRLSTRSFFELLGESTSTASRMLIPKPTPETRISAGAWRFRRSVDGPRGALVRATEAGQRPYGRRLGHRHASHRGALTISLTGYPQADFLH